MVDSSAEEPNLGDPSGSAACRGDPRRPFVLVGSFAFSTISHLGVGRGAPEARNIRDLGGNPPKYGGLQCGVSIFRRPVARRGLPPRRFLVGSFEFRLLSYLGVGEMGSGRIKY